MQQEPPQANGPELSPEATDTPESRRRHRWVDCIQQRYGTLVDTERGCQDDVFLFVILWFCVLLSPPSYGGGTLFFSSLLASFLFTSPQNEGDLFVIKEIQPNKELEQFSSFLFSFLAKTEGCTYICKHHKIFVKTKMKFRRNYLSHA